MSGELVSRAEPVAWQDGWHPAARAVPSPNHGPRPEGVAIDVVIIHSISLPPGQYGGPAIEQLFTNCLDCQAHPYYEQLKGLEVSAHFLIRRDGALLQFVACDRRAWHAGASNLMGRSNCNDFSIGIELEGLEGDAFEPAQYQALAHLLQDLAAAYPIRQVAGHEDVAPGRKSDPGAGFDWPHLMGQLSWPPQAFPYQAPPTSEPPSRR